MRFINSFNEKKCSVHIGSIKNCGLANAQSHGVSEFTILAFCLFQLLCTLFISGAEQNFNKVQNCFPKPLLWKWRFDAPTEIRRHSNAFQAFEEIWLYRLSKLNEVQARLIRCILILVEGYLYIHG